MNARNLALFLLATPLSMFAQAEPKTSTLSCWPNPSTFRSAKARTTTFHSEKAGDAYAEVTANAKSEPEDVQICSNTVQLFYSFHTKEYKLIFHDHRDGDGLGITILGWSKKGTELLFQTDNWSYETEGTELLFQTDNWSYETEGNVERETFLFDSSFGRIRKIPVNAAFVKLYGKNCEFEERVLGWHGDTAFVVRISKTPLTESYDQKFCVQNPTDYVFDLKTYEISKPK